MSQDWKRCLSSLPGGAELDRLKAEVTVDEWLAKFRAELPARQRISRKDLCYLVQLLTVYREEYLRLVDPLR